MSQGFGARLREQRERQHIELRTVAEETKIKLSLLEALERDDVSHWPSGIFRRAFVRAYAKSIGLDPDVILREFVELYPDPGEEVTTPFGVPADDQPAGAIARLRAAVGATFRSRPPEAMPLGIAMSSPTLAAPPAVVQPVPPPIVDRSSSSTTDPPAAATIDLAAVAPLCSALARVGDPGELPMILERIADTLDAAGLIVWLWDPEASALRPSLAHGYSPRVVAQLPPVERDADNATAAAFRLGETCSVAGSAHANGALAVPLVASPGCGGVLAIELRHGGERSAATRAAAEIIAAQLATMVRADGAAESEPSQPPARAAV